MDTTPDPDDYDELDALLRDFWRGLGIIEGLRIAQAILKGDDNDDSNRHSADD